MINDPSEQTGDRESTECACGKSNESAAIHNSCDDAKTNQTNWKAIPASRNLMPNLMK